MNDYTLPEGWTEAKPGMIPFEKVVSLTVMCAILAIIFIFGADWWLDDRKSTTGSEVSAFMQRMKTAEQALSITEYNEYLSEAQKHLDRERMKHRTDFRPLPTPPEEVIRRAKPFVE